jgi:hypothetical protein
MLAKQLDRKSSEGSCKDSTCQCQDEVKPNTFLRAGLPSIDASADKATIALLQQQLAESKEDLTRLEHKLDAAERLKDTLNLEVSQLKAALNHARSTSEQTSVSQVEYERSSISKLPPLKRKLPVRFPPLNNRGRILIFTRVCAFVCVCVCVCVCLCRQTKMQRCKNRFRCFWRR